jgi:hypothetical protein
MSSFADVPVDVICEFMIPKLNPMDTLALFLVTRRCAKCVQFGPVADAARDSLMKSSDQFADILGLPRPDDHDGSFYGMFNSTCSRISRIECTTEPCFVVWGFCKDGVCRPIHFRTEDLTIIADVPGSPCKWNILLSHLLKLLDTGIKAKHLRRVSKLLHFVAIHVTDINHNPQLRLHVAVYLTNAGLFQESIDICDVPDRNANDICSIMQNTFQLDLEGQHRVFTWLDIPQCPLNLADSRAIKCAKWLLNRGSDTQIRDSIKMLMTYCQWQSLYDYFYENDNIPHEACIKYLMYIMSMYALGYYERVTRWFPSIGCQLLKANPNFHMMNIRAMEKLGRYDDMMDACNNYECSLYSNYVFIPRCYPKLKEIAMRNSSKFNDVLP